MDRQAHDAPVDLRASAKSPLTPADDAGRYRLTIEREAAGYVYKTLDRITGEVIRQFPREEVLKLRQSAGYDVGKIISTQV